MNFHIRLIIKICLISLFVSSCGGGSSNERPSSATSPNNRGIPSLEQVFSYQTSSNSPQLVKCAKLFLERESCRVADIKPLGVDITGDISLSEIKSRLVISHDWMADSFIAALEVINDQNFLNLFKPLNTIVLSYDIRPSFYHGLTASMYIDARYLWRNTSDWNSIFKQDDFRTDFQTEFQFDSFLRHVNKNTGNYVVWSNTYRAGSYTSRTANQISPGLFRLLSHELAHANDFLPPEILPTIGNSGTIYQNYIAPNVKISDELTASSPLNSSLLHSAGSIAFQGAAMTDQIRNTTALEAGRAFESDSAADFYGYSTTREDLAMLFETYMMYKKYGSVSDVAFLTIPTTETPVCDDYIVKWGQRNRLADSSVKERAIFISNKILQKDITPDLANIGSAPTNLPTNMGWCASRTASIPADRLRSGKANQPEHNYLEDRIRE